MARYSASSLSARTRLWFASALGCVVAVSSCSGDGDPVSVRGPRDLLRSETFASLLFELDSVAGNELSQTVTDRVLGQTALLVDKPGGIKVVRDDTLPASEPDHAWTPEELEALADQSEDTERIPGQARVHVLSIDGHAESDNAEQFMLGVSWNGHTIVLFDETIRRACAAGQLKVSTVSEFCEECEALIWLHEFGHLLGLVGGIPMIEDHNDPEHPGHDKNPDCLMHWLFHHGSAVDKLRSRVNAGDVTPIGFDRQCLEDLRAVREGAR
jgi:hypothetical protein